MWPDEVVEGGAVALQASLGPAEVEWAVANILVTQAEPPRAPLLARVVETVEKRLADSATPVLAEYLRRCETIGRRVRARTIPLGPGGVALEGVARTVKTDGTLVLETDDGRRLAVRPQNLGLLEPLAK